MSTRQTQNKKVLAETRRHLREVTQPGPVKETKGGTRCTDAGTTYLDPPRQTCESRKKGHDQEARTRRKGWGKLGDRVATATRTTPPAHCLFLAGKRLRKTSSYGKRPHGNRRRRNLDSSPCPKPAVNPPERTKEYIWRQGQLNAGWKGELEGESILRSESTEWRSKKGSCPRAWAFGASL